MKIKNAASKALPKASETYAEAFGALSHLRRLQVFFFLVRANGELTAGEIQAVVKFPAPTLSHHLEVLYRAGLVHRRKEQRHVYYSVNRAMASEMARLLNACC